MEWLLHLLPSLAVQVLVLGAVGAGIWWAVQPRYHFLVCIGQDSATLRRGKVTAAFLQEIASVCAEHDVHYGWIGGVLRGRQITLKFSRNVPPACRQRLRNVWGVQA